MSNSSLPCGMHDMSSALFEALHNAMAGKVVTLCLDLLSLFVPHAPAFSFCMAAFRSMQEKPSVVVATVVSLSRGTSRYSKDHSECLCLQRTLEHVLVSHC